MWQYDLRERVDNVEEVSELLQVSQNIVNNLWLQIIKEFLWNVFLHDKWKINYYNFLASNLIPFLNNPIIIKNKHLLQLFNRIIKGTKLKFDFLL